MIADTEDECFEMLFEHEKEHGVLIEYYGSCGSEFIVGKLADEIKDEQENMPMLPPEERKTCFCETECGFREEQIAKEAGRCLRCDFYGCGTMEGGRF